MPGVEEQKKDEVRDGMEAKENTENNPPSHYPIDRGWAWAVLIGAFLENILLFGSRRTFGLLYKDFMVAYNASATEVALAATVQTAVISISSLLILSVGTRCCSTRVYVMLAGVLGFAAYLINSFAKSVSVLIMSQGILFGLGHSFCHGPTVVTIGKYFKKRRGLATLLASVGGSVGSLSFPPLVQYLLETYGLRGVLTIMAGIALNFSVAGALLRPLSFYDKRKKKVSTVQDDTETDKEFKEKLLNTEYDVPIKSMKENSGKQDDRLFKSLENFSFTPIERARTSSDSFKLNPRKERDDVVKDDFKSLSNRNIGMIGSIEDIVGSLCSLPGTDINTLQHEMELKTEDTKNNKPCCIQMFSSLKKVLLMVFSMEVVCNRLFIMFITVVCFSIIGVAQTSTFLPAHAEDIGISKQEIAYLLSIMGSIDLCSKLFLAFISDLSFIRRHILLAFANIIMGIVLNFIHFFKDFKSMLGLIVTYGLFGQSYVGLFPVIIGDFVGIKNLSSAIGIVTLAHGAMLSITSPLIGLIRDATGSFDVAYHIMGSCYLFAGCLLLTEPLFRRLEEKRQKSKNIQEE